MVYIKHLEAAKYNEAEHLQDLRFSQGLCWKADHVV